MKKPVVDYRQFRLSKINDPRFSHLKLLGWWIPYLILYFAVGRLVPSEECYMVHSTLDDMIPFCEFFVVPYVLWYFYIILSLGYFALYNIEHFKKLQKYMVITQFISIAIYFVFPTTQLREANFERDNICAQLVGFLYSVDANTNACPSLHVAISLAIASVWRREKSANIWLKTAAITFAFLVCMSTVFIKQHSILDAFAAVFVCLIAEYWLFWRKGARTGKNTKEEVL